MASSDEQTLQQISDYIDKYEHDLALRESIVNLGNATTRQQIAMQKAHLADLKAKYAYLQTYYAQHGELPTTVHFDAHTNDGAGMYRTEVGGEIKMVMLIAGASGTQIVTAPDFTGTLSSSNESIQTVGYHDGNGAQSGNNKYGMRLTGTNYGSTTITWTTTGTIFNGMSTSTGYYGESWKWWACSLDTNNSVELLNTTGIQMNSHTFQGGTYFSLDADDVPTDSIWDYYNDDILPNINPDNAAMPGGYEPEDPHDPVEEPELPETDEGEPPATQNTRIITSPSWFITQYILNNTLLESLGKTLWSSWLDSNSNVWENFLFDYFQQTGTFNITAALDYIISLRVYPFDLGGIINPTPPEGFYGESDGVYMGTGKTNFTYSSGVTRVMTINSVSGFLDLGECEVGSDYAYNDFRDIYNTTILCYLPYCGMVELNPADVWGKTLKCHYFIDFQSGGCTAIIKCPTGNGVTTFPVASKSGQIGFTLPLTSTNAGQLAAQFIGDATRAVGTIAGMGFDIGRNVSSYLQGNMNTADMAMGIGQSTVGAGLSLANQAVNILSRPGVNMPMLSGGSGCESLMMYPSPFITIRRGRYAKPENYGHSEGYAIAMSGRIGDYKGMNCFTGVDASGLSCHADERDAIVKLLEKGVYLPVD